ncbi:MAG: apolipoprotein N-acyltransferase [Cellvibrionaceae bacterium]
MTTSTKIPTSSVINLSPKYWPIIILLIGALIPLSYAPFNFWPIAIISLSVFTYSLFQTNGHSAFWRAFWFGLGMFGTGISWVFVSIHVFGKAPIIFAGLLTAVFVAFIALVFALPFLALGKWCSRHPLYLSLSVASLWCIGEWIRTWLFTGFPWLFLGYAHIDTWLAGWAPLTGVIGISFVTAITGGLIAYSWIEKNKILRPIIASGLIIFLWGVGFVSSKIEWTKNYQQPISVGIAQGNIPQEKKWDDDFVQPTLDRYFSLSESLWRNDWVIWPEAAIPLIMNYGPDYDQLAPALNKIERLSLESNTAFITGILYLSPSDAKFYNSLVGFGTASGIYHKQRLAPFGDYVPLSDWLGPLLKLFNLPHSILELGPKNQRGIQIGGVILTPAICYEIAYPDLVAHGAKDGNALITVSNDAWFGSSLGPLQHMQIAQMRALETGRYMIRSTNNGVSAIVNEKGKILVRSKQFVQESINSEIQLKKGQTIFMLTGSEPIVFLCLLLISICIIKGRKKSNP